MAKINTGRVILGGLVAGIVINVLEGIMHGVVWASRDADILVSLNRPEAGSVNQIIALNVWGFALGILTIALYAAIRPRMGSGPKTAVCAGLFTWAGASLMGAAIPAILGIYRVDVTITNICFELLMLALAAVAGAALYQESGARA